MVIDTLPVACTDAMRSAIGRSGEACTARSSKTRRMSNNASEWRAMQQEDWGTRIIARGIQLIKVLLYVTAKIGYWNLRKKVKF